jgi:DnaJ homolog subfamily C member 13
LVTSLAANNYQLQCDLIRNGVLWSILLFMFDYDYTLEESGVEIEEKSNKQVSVVKHSRRFVDYSDIQNALT